MSAKEILSEKGKIPLMYFSMQRFLRVLEALHTCKGRCTLTLFFPCPLQAPQTTHCSKTVLLFQRQSVSFGFSTFICRAAVFMLREAKLRDEMLQG